MALPLSGQITMDDIRIELGVPSQSPFGLNEARTGTYVAINPCSTYQPPTTGGSTVSLSDWYGYNQTQSCGPTYDYYLATEYSCFPCTLTGNYSVPVAFPSGTGVYYNRYYSDIDATGFVYKLESTSSPQTSLLLTTAASSTNCNTVCGL